MKDTIKAKIGYTVQYGVKKGFRATTTNVTTKIYGTLYDGENQLMTAEMRTLKDYKEESKDNECFCFMEKFTTTKGKEFIYWRDEEINKDYLTKLKD